ncbi:uncharacterized protein RJT21DRAFT_115099 [Scheffersomyces amazonensis]|uniref:uncharacterized protein n=1 Tax=Scheffersomyces amazonensis TaxID=1078765 RepID=UPI00315D3095
MSHRAIFKKRRWDREDGTPSGANSRAGSASRTPLRDNDDSDLEEETEEDFKRIQELLSQRLQSLELAVDPENIEVNKEDRRGASDRRQYHAEALNKARITSEATTINDIIRSLTMSRTEVSSSSRELLLAQLYKLIVTKPILIYNEENIGSSNYVDEEKVQKVVNLFIESNYRTEVEFLYLYRSVVALLISNIDDFGEMISTDLLNKIRSLIQEPATSVITNENKANLITGFIAITLVLHNGSSSFGIDDKINWLMEIAEGYSTSAVLLRKNIESGDREHSTLVNDKNEDKRLINEAYTKVDHEISVAASALSGVACFISLLPKGDYLNEIVETLLIRIITLLDEEDLRDVSRASARVIAVIYELYSYDDVEDQEDEDYEEFNPNGPYYEQGLLFAKLERLANLSTKRISKKDKKQAHSIFRNILNTLKVYVDPIRREQVRRRSPEGLEIIGNIMDSTYIRLSKYKSLPINSWVLYSRLRILKWSFSFGLHDQLVCNESIRDILRDEDGEHGGGFEIDQGLLQEESSYKNFVSDYMDSKHIHDDRRRTEKIRKERTQKVVDEAHRLNVSS